MAQPIPSPTTLFSRDVLGRYACNTLDEALATTPEASDRADARPFDIIVIGGGTFGAAIAQQLFANDWAGNHRILVLEGGPFFVPEHNQNLAAAIGHLGDKLDGQPRSIASLRAQGHQEGEPFAEVWGLPWHSPIGFSGLSYNVGGRSVHWGGWSPRLLDAEMPTTPAASPHRWPQTVVDDLKARYFDEAAAQIGVDETNDFIHGPLHSALRQRLAAGIDSGEIPDAVPLGELPLTLALPPDASAAEKTLSRLEAPLAVQSRASRPGVFTTNKFSTVPLIVKAVRDSVREATPPGGGLPDDVKRRLMLVPNCHVTRLGHANGRITQVFTNLQAQPIPVPENGVVIIALGTIESIRLALVSFEGLPDYANIGKNLMAHLRSNLQFRIPREALGSLIPADLRELQTSALFVKGRALDGEGRVIGHFHQQITASGLGCMGFDSEAELFKTIPDLDDLEHFRTADDTSVVITIRGIGEMTADNPRSFVRLDPETDEFGVRRAFVDIQKSTRDQTLHDHMDANAFALATWLANGQPIEPPPGPNNPSPVGGSFRRDGLGSTHHECGGLEMGTDPATSVTDANGRFWHLDNAYAAGPALFPTIGSPNPMLTGIALCRRLADHLIPQADVQVAESGFTLLFDGQSLGHWRMSTITNQPADRNNPGCVVIRRGTLETLPGNDLGLLWYTQPMPADYLLRLEWLRFDPEGNAGVFVRFPHPDSRGYDNTAYVPVDFGFEVQIDELEQPDGQAIHRTGAIYGQPGQQLNLQPARPAGQWNQFEIRVEGQTYTVFLNGTQVSQFTNTNPGRGLPSNGAPSFIGLQLYPGSRMAFRNLRFRAL